MRSSVSTRRPSVMMLGTFGLRPKATLRARALGVADSLSDRWNFSLTTTPWDNPADRGQRWIERDVPVINTRVATPFLFPLSTWEMIREAKHFQPELIHLFKPKGFGDLAARRLSRQLPIVVDMDDWEGNGGWNEIGGYGPLQRRLFDWQERTWPSRAAAMTVASRELERRASELGAAKDAIFYVPNGLTRERFGTLSRAQCRDAPDEIRAAIGKRRVILLYTRFVEFAPDVAAEVIAGVRRQIPDAVLLVVGASADGQAEVSLEQHLAQASTRDSVIFAGWTEPHIIPALLKLGHVAIHPFADNLVNRSKCSVKLLELMAAGGAIVTNQVGENASMIEDGQSGMLVSPDDVDAMVRRTTDVLASPSLARELGAAAQRRVHEHYLWENLSLTVEQAYNYALDRRSQTP